MNRTERDKLNGIVRDANALLMNGPNSNAPHITNVAVLENVLDDILSVLHGQEVKSVAKLLKEDEDARKCNHTWVGGMCYVHDEDAATVNAERVARGVSPLECERCGASYRESGN